MEAICDCAADAGRLLKSGKGGAIENNLYYNRYIATFSELKDMNELINYVNKNYLVANSKYGKYIICEDDSKLIYYRTLVDCARDNFSSKSTLSKHSDASINEPYIIKWTKRKFYYSNEYIPVSVEAVPIEKSSELLSGNIGKSPEMDNTEISTEIKESVPSYSVGSETL